MQKKSLLTGTYLYIWSVQQTTCLCLAPTKRAMPKARAATAVQLDTKEGTVLELPAVEIKLNQSPKMVVITKYYTDNKKAETKQG